MDLDFNNTRILADSSRSRVANINKNLTVPQIYVSTFQVMFSFALFVTNLLYPILRTNFQLFNCFLTQQDVIINIILNTYLIYPDSAQLVSAPYRNSFDIFNGFTKF